MPIVSGADDGLHAFAGGRTDDQTGIEGGYSRTAKRIISR